MLPWISGVMGSRPITAQGVPYYQQNFVSEIRRVTAALKWNRFSLMGHSFGGTVGGTFSCLLPEMVDKLVLLDSSPLTLDSKEINSLLTCTWKAIEHLLQAEASKTPPKWLLKNNPHVGEGCGKLLLQIGATQEAAGKLYQESALYSAPSEAAKQERTALLVARPLAAQLQGAPPPVCSLAMTPRS